MKLKCSLLLMLVGLLVWGCIASSTVWSQQKAKENSKRAKSTPTPKPSPQPSPRSYSKDMKELRARFNRDKGKVRLVTLLSPT